MQDASGLLTRSLKAQRSRIARGPFARLRVWGPRGRVLGRLLTFSPNSGPNPSRLLTRSLKAQRSRNAGRPLSCVIVWGRPGRLLIPRVTLGHILPPKPCPHSSNTGRRPAVSGSLEPCGAPIPAGYSPLAGACGFLGFDCDYDILHDYPHDFRLFSCFCCRRVVVVFNYDYSEAGAL